MAISNEEQFSKHLHELLFPFSLSILFVIYLIKDFLRHAPAIQICASFMWLFVGISFFLQDNNWNEAKTTNKTISLEHNNIFSKDCFTKDFQAIVFNLIITLFIWSLIILAINNLIYAPDNSNDSIFYHGASILVALGIVFISAREILGLDYKIANILVAVLMLVGSITMALYSSQ